MESQNNNNSEEPKTGEKLPEDFPTCPEASTYFSTNLLPLPLAPPGVNDDADDDEEDDVNAAHLAVLAERLSPPAIFVTDFDKLSTSSLTLQDESLASELGTGASCPSIIRVDPILDLWLVDEELSGRFTISTLDSHRAIIFKVKTTSPYHSWVRPVYGLMKPNVTASIQVKCECEKVSRRRLGMDEFSIQVATVPLAAAVMTSDLYTSAVSLNLPELLSIWEKVESSQNDVESHRVFCRIQGNLLKNMVTGELNGNSSNTKVSSSSLHLPHSLEVECYLARELPKPEECGRNMKTNSSQSHQNNHRQQEKHCCGAVRRLQILCFSLSLLFLASLAHIFYQHYYYNQKE
ncbi:unnamed protein product [Orchesella dallaii]|uniref:MSP domain-containing protein n=1 Tax=Orchesella dallaii TaxID=48710 RepID=A0ABP1S241_9HEXA